jgi:hypothetical protein
MNNMNLPTFVTDTTAAAAAAAATYWCQQCRAATTHDEYMPSPIPAAAMHLL